MITKPYFLNRLYNVHYLRTANKHINETATNLKTKTKAKKTNKQINTLKKSFLELTTSYVSESGNMKEI